MQVEYEKGKSPVKLWTDGVLVDPNARDQIRNTASMPFIYKHVAVMPDVHLFKRLDQRGMAYILGWNPKLIPDKAISKFLKQWGITWRPKKKNTTRHLSLRL